MNDCCRQAAELAACYVLSFVPDAAGRHELVKKATAYAERELQVAALGLDKSAHPKNSGAAKPQESVKNHSCPVCGHDLFIPQH